ncbi:MAG: hypothetical protein AAGH15_23930 [Myxococcota bacterium]
MHRHSGGAFALALVFASGCGGGNGPGIGFDLGDFGGGTMDMGRGDLGDAGSSDMDGGDPVDGGDMGDAGIDPGSCESVEADRFDLGEDERPDPRRVAVVAGDTGFYLAWVDQGGGLRSLRGLRVPTTGEPGEPVELTAGVTRPREPALLALDDGFLLAYTDNDTGGDGEQVLTRRIGADGAPIGTATVITEGPLRHSAAALAREGTTFLAAFLESDVGGGLAQLQTVNLDAQGRVPTGATIRDVGAANASLRSPQLGPRTGLGYALAWVAANGDGDREAFYAPLSVTGALDGTPVTVSREANVNEHIALALLSQEIIPEANDLLGFAFDVRISGARAESHLRIHDALTTEGGSEVPAHASPQTSRSPSIVPFGGGFVVGQLLITDTDDAGFVGPTVGLSLLDRAAAFVTTLTFGDVLASSSADGGPTALAVASDGTFLITWVDRTATGGTSYHARRVRCAL